MSGPDGTDTLMSIELLQFAGGGVRTLEHADRDAGDNGKSDILLRNDNRQVMVWLMNGLAIASGSTFSNASTYWKIDGAQDYNGDGKSDWQ